MNSKCNARQIFILNSSRKYSHFNVEKFTRQFIRKWKQKRYFHDETIERFEMASDGKMYKDIM